MKMRKTLTIILALALVFASVGFAFAATNQELYLNNLAKTGTQGQQAWALHELSKAGFEQMTNQELYLNNLLAAGTAGQKAWAKAELAKIGAVAAATPAVTTPAASADPGMPEKGSTMVLASTTSTQDTGFFDMLIPIFDAKYGTTTKVVAVGSGEAMAMGQRGDADVLLVHSRAAEDKFIADGWGVNRKDVMYNFFVLVGPKDDPAKIKGMTSAVEAFKAVYDSQSTFLSRADKSGTHTKELTIWTKSGSTPVAATDKWYLETGKGMGDTLTMANEMGGYTITDSGTWGTMQVNLPNLELLVQGDSVLYNPYGVIAVNPAKYPNTNYKAAMAFVNFITSEEGQQIIKDFKNKNGQYIFVPNAK